MNDESETKPARTLITSSNSSMMRPRGHRRLEAANTSSRYNRMQAIDTFFAAATVQLALKLMRGQVALGLSLVTCIAAIGYAHFAQVEDRRLMHEGVVRDKARLKEQRREAKRQQRAQEK
jgi:hypothetical protein